MRTDLDHLPANKRSELERIVRILFEEFDAAKAHRSHAHRRNGQILKVILFGSYARGDWVADPVGGYYSDYDLLVVVDHEDLTDVVEYWAKADERLLQEVTITKRISAPVNFIVHSLADVNEKLRLGRYFFLDILKDGVALYEAPGQEFERPEPLSPQAARAEAERASREWLESADQFVRQAHHAINDGAPKIAAFDFHQATERLYVCVLLVLTLYSPKSHRLNFLRSQAERLAPSLALAWPRQTRFEQRSFELLRRAYVEARYSPNYKISAEELAWLSVRVCELQRLVRQACEAKLADLREAAEK
ncbi:MAG: nucleotidyltransferase [Phenylobacterium sp.]|uniref:HEPN domain-containing protein n=1 Tax=Phenylobacterium sp. TaxID=1871053 RepID=UPI0025F503A2|nr:HEPN domain-containing protein [Phenylobacterium sp.]MBA4013255.1 nucleotidyltransferase [Phenylobacterium sp.]